MRLIDADSVRQRINETMSDDYVYSTARINALIDEAQTIDAVEVVRCKDCRWYEIAELNADGTEDKRFKPSLCVLQNRTMDNDWFCADGERK